MSILAKVALPYLTPLVLLPDHRSQVLCGVVFINLPWVMVSSLPFPARRAPLLAVDDDDEFAFDDDFDDDLDDDFDDDLDDDFDDDFEDDDLDDDLDDDFDDEDLEDFDDDFDDFVDDEDGF